MDEEQEHAEFVKAVEAWRGAKTSASSANNNNTDHNNNAHAIGTTVNTQSEKSSPNERTKLIAQNLAKQLELEQKEFFEKMEKQKMEAEKRLYLVRHS